MSRSGIFETVVGAVVIAVAAVFLTYAYSVSGKQVSAGAYNLNAIFGRVDGITVGSEVRIAGVKVGTVSGFALDTNTYEAKLILRSANSSLDDSRTIGGHFSHQDTEVFGTQKAKTNERMATLLDGLHRGLRG